VGALEAMTAPALSKRSWLAESLEKVLQSKT
jgi:hypothetical protein